MKKTLFPTALAFTLVAVATLSAGSAFAQSNSASTSASASARVVAAIGITKNTDLNFGDVVAGGTAGTVVMSTGGVRSVSGGTTLGNSNGAAAAAFTVTGVSGATYAITLPSSPITISSGGNNMSVGTFLGSKGATSTLTGGTDSFSVGATLSVGSSQVAGSYTGNFTVSVNYN